jgi:SAM-dependent methyltransferase
MASKDSFPQKVTDLLDGVYPAFAMLAGLQLDVFTPLSQRPLTAQQLAEELQVGSVRLARLLFALAQAGLLDWDGACFSATTESAVYLNRKHARYMAGLADFFAYVWRDVVPNTATTIRHGHPQARHDFNDMTPSEIEHFLQVLHPGTVAAGHLLADQHDFSHYHKLLDVGGGSGGLALALAERNPQLQTAVLELPLVAPITRQFLQSANSRVQLLAADFVRDEIPGSYDVLVMKSFTQILGETTVPQALQKAFALLEPGGDLYIQAAILDDDRTTPAWTVQFDLVLLNLYEDGRAYTESKYRHWLAAAGFVRIERPDQSLIIARKP